MIFDVDINQTFPFITVITMAAQSDFIATQSDSTSEYGRMHRFKELSMMYINGMPVSKLDYVAHISLHDGAPYFNVFRRYNSRFHWCWVCWSLL